MTDININMNINLRDIIFLKKPNNKFLKKLYLYLNTTSAIDKKILNYLKYKVDKYSCSFYLEMDELYIIISSIYFENSIIHNKKMNIELYYDIYDTILEYIYANKGYTIFMYHNILNKSLENIYNIYLVKLELYNITRGISIEDINIIYKGKINSPKKVNELYFRLRENKEINKDIEDTDCIISYIDFFKKKSSIYKEIDENIILQYILIYMCQWICGFYSYDYIIYENQIIPLNEKYDIDILDQPFDFKKIISLIPNKNNFFNNNFIEKVIGYMYSMNENDISLMKSLINEIYDIIYNKSQNYNKQETNDIYIYKFFIIILNRINKMKCYFN